MRSGSLNSKSSTHGSGGANVKLVWLLLMIPVAYLVVSRSIAHLCEQRLYDGDRLEVRDCRECLGKGHDEKYARDFNGLGINCMACLGTGKIQVLVPGLQRPTQVWGAVIDWQAGESWTSHQCPKDVRLDLENSILLSTEETSLRGALPGIGVWFKTDGGRVSAKTDRGGRFGCKLLPGRYVVEVEAEGFAKLQSTLEIEALRAPVWLEKNTILHGRSPEERKSKDGIAVIILLERSGEGSGMLRTFLLPE